MLKNYLKTALRNLIRESTSTTINVLGLTLGITCSLVLFLMIRHLSSFDSFHAKKERIYRVVHQSEGNHGTSYTAGIPTVLPDAFRLDFPEAEEVVLMSYRAETQITIPQRSGPPKLYNEEAGTVFTESNFFRIFDHKILMGEKSNPLDGPNKAVISRRWAEKYFESEDALGETVKVGEHEFTIGAIMENPPHNTDFPFDLMLSYSTIKAKNQKEGWDNIWSDEHCYFLLKPGVSIATIESRMKAFTDKYLGKDQVRKPLFSIQPLSEFHYDDRYGTFTYKTVSRNMLMSLAAIAFILIITACINFINLSTAEAIKRSKEVGIRKSLGSTRSQLIRQFLGETTIVSGIATILAIGMAQLALTFLNPFLELHLSLNFLNDPFPWIFMVVMTAVIALFSGLYPAFIVSGFSPALALKSMINNKNSSGYNMRRVLVVTQFVISQFFIFGTIIVVYQVQYFNSTELGFKKDAILITPIPWNDEPSKELMSWMRTLRDEMKRVPGVKDASLSSAPPSSGNVSGTSFTIEGKEETFGTQVKQVDGDYVNLFELQLLSGQNIADMDTAAGFLVNEKLCSIVGYTPEQAVGKVISMWGRRLPIAGVVKDFHTVSLKSPIEATILMNRILGYETIALSINPGQLQSVIDHLKQKWESMYTEHIFDYQFLDQNIKEFYDGEQKMSVLLGTFSAIAIFIGCLGLFGLATYLANQKTKEIGVRKVLGASVESIMFLFSKEYIKLITIGFLISGPLAWYVMGKFLEGFTYRIDIGAEIFLMGLGATLLIATLTVGYRSFRSAVANPARSLRSE
ncbi:MAG: ABC transporter permease [Chryseolinea sp.]